MSGTLPFEAGSGAQVLARIEAPRDWLARPAGYRKEVCDWMIANGVDPCAVPLPGVVEVVLLDAPAIRRTEYVPGTDRRWQLGPDGEAVTRVVHSLLRVPLPEHLADPT